MAKAKPAAAEAEDKEPSGVKPEDQAAGGEAPAADGEAPAADVAAAPAPAATKPAKAAPKAADPEPELMPEAGGRTDAASIDLLMDACERFGVNPEADARPRELASWRFYPGDRLEGRPAAVVIVTQGGLKLKHWADPNQPMDQDTEDKLRTIFRAFTISPTKEVIPTALPSSLVLPVEAVTGQVLAKGHVHRGGYLRRQT